MATITTITDRTVGTCTGMSLPALEVCADTASGHHEYRVREWAYRGVWQMQELRAGATGGCDADYDDVGEFRTSEDALADIESLVDEPVAADHKNPE